MSVKLKEKLICAFDEGWNKGNLDAMLSLCSPDFIHHRPPFPDLVGVIDEKLDIESTFSTFSDIHFQIHELLVDGDTAAVRWTWQATHCGSSPELPMPPTGNRIAMEGCSILHLQNGLISEEWEYADYLGFYTQLGIHPPPG